MLVRPCALLALAGLAGALAAAAAGAQPRRVEALTYPVGAFALEYALEHPAHPTLAELLALEVELRVASAGLLPPHPATRNVRFALGRVPAGTRLYSAALRHVSERLLAAFRERGIDAVLVTFPQIEAETGRDLRPQGEKRLLVRIWTGRVERVASVADGERFGDATPDERTNHEAHRFIREGSPVRAGGPRGLLRVRELEDYAFRLSRHPGRRVDARLSPGELPGATRLDLHVAESRPLLLYGEVSNTGTEGTTRLRQRLGLSHSQLTGRDDVLSVDYVTGNFDELHGVWGSYEAPLRRLSRLRAEAFGSYSEYDASEVGVSSVDAQGDQWQAGGRLVLNVLQHRELFVDVFAGASWRHVSVENTIGFGGGSFRDDAEEAFFLPEGGLRLRRRTEISSVAVDLSVDRNLGSVAGTDESELIGLGSIDPDEDFTRLRWQGGVSVFLEPALRWRRWADPSTPASSTLAHELRVATRGQVSLGDRLIPQFQQVAGGLYTVRGYDQSLVAGDTVLIGSAEYRLHLARLLLPGSQRVELPVLGELKVRPEHVYGRPDWDLVLLAFVDAARVIQQDRKDFESDDTLLGIGLGAELQLLRHLSVRVDLGWPQRKLAIEEQDSPEIHTSLTVMF